MQEMKALFSMCRWRRRVLCCRVCASPATKAYGWYALCAFTVPYHQAPARLVVGQAGLRKRSKKQKGLRTGCGAETPQAQNHEGAVEEVRLLFSA
ncbi:hypothetical protein Y032_0124g1216 [Ancylostoma ceylanicum]|uniref:Uncharacterized protein n=1 Tax=Ancylostoma ceylanicum TaxID=53326 RepID=A0A016T921_9BILA|nr:hypothetical protein Y032_0124g1216 [Ancylostoma ceylanicum]